MTCLSVCHRYHLFCVATCVIATKPFWLKLQLGAQILEDLKLGLFDDRPRTRESVSHGG